MPGPAVRQHARINADVMCDRLHITMPFPTDKLVPGAAAPAAIARWLSASMLTPLGLTADGGNRDMSHCCIGLGAMPMALTGLDVHHIAHVDLALFMLRRHHAGARSHDQDLVAGMRVPSGGAALAEIHHAAVVIRRVPRLYDRLT